MAQKHSNEKIPVMDGTAEGPSRVTKDPVCGMDVNPADAVGSEEFGGQKYYFCSASCLEKFQADPEQYAIHVVEHGPAADKPKKAKATQGGYTCPMHPEVRQPEPGACPKCGMALEPVSPPAPATRTEYTCPMHPEVVQNEPGSCPKCGMALEPKTATAKEEENSELHDMKRRFWISLALIVPLLSISMVGYLPSGYLWSNWANSHGGVLAQLIIATPIVFWCCWARCWNCALADRRERPFALCWDWLQRRRV